MKKLIYIICLLVFVSCSTQEANLMIDESAKIESPQVNFISPDILKRYRAFYVSPIKIYSNDSGRLVPAQEYEIKRLEHIFRKKIINSLGSKYTQFNHPAKDVAIININISDVWSTRALEALRPGLLISNNLGAGATMQADFYDSVNNRKIGTVWDSRSGERQSYLSGFGKWSGTKEAFGEWAAMLGNNIRQ